MDYYVKNDLSMILDNRWTSQGNGTISGKRGNKIEVYQEADFTFIANGSGVQSDYKIVEGIATLKTQEELNIQQAAVAAENNKIEAELVYLEASADTTVVWNGHTLRWHKPRHWRDWHSILSLGDTSQWYSEANVQLTLTHADIIDISRLIQIEHNNAYNTYRMAIAVTG